MTKYHAKLEKFADAEGFSRGFHARKECDYTTGMEPDQDAGWCECCETNTVKLALIIGVFI